MSNSTLIDYTRISPNQSGQRNHAIDTVTIHCVVGQLSVETIGNIFANPSAEASSNYGIGSDGRIGMYVEECDRSWCSSSSDNDNRAITIECASDASHPYAVNGSVYSTLIDLLVDICQRNGIPELRWRGDRGLIGQTDAQNMTVHRWFADKACPGDYLYNLHGQIANEVNARLGEDRAINVQLYETNGTDAQKWIIRDKQDGTEFSTLQNVATGMYLDVSGANAEPGVNVQVYKGNGADAQKFIVDKEKFENDIVCTIRSAIDADMVLDVSGASRDNGANIQLYASNGTTAQKWTMVWAGDGAYYLINQVTGKALDVVGGGK